MTLNSEAEYQNQRNNTATDFSTASRLYTFADSKDLKKVKTSYNSENEVNFREMLSVKKLGNTENEKISGGIFENFEENCFRCGAKATKTWHKKPCCETCYAALSQRESVGLKNRENLRFKSNIFRLKF